MASDTDTATPEPGPRFGLQGLRARIAAALGQNFCVIASKVESNPQFINVYYRRVDGTSGADVG